MNHTRERFEYILTRAFFAALRLCPAPAIYGICRGFALFFYALGTSRRRITLKNLGLAFPEMCLTEHKKIARSSYDHFGRCAAVSVMILAGKIKRADLLKMVDGSDLQKLLDVEADNERGILCLTGHFGNFELLAHYTGMQLKRDSYVVARQGSNKLIDDRIVTPLRESFGNKVIYKKRALPRAAIALKNGNNLGLLIDIKSNPRQGVPVTFFGQKTNAIKSSAYLQIKLNPPVIPVTMAHVGHNRYKLIVGEQIHWTDNGKSKDEQIAELTQIHQTALEKLIRQYPEQWLWMHDRWK
jgi:KDO2-lipid IV(A) lauroyltransferase